MKDTITAAAGICGAILLGILGFALIVVCWVLAIALYGAFFGALGAGAYLAFRWLTGVLL